MKTPPLDERQELHKIPRLEFTYNYFSLKFVYQTSTVVVVVAVLVVVFLTRACVFFLRTF